MRLWGLRFGKHRTKDSRQGEARYNVESSEREPGIAANILSEFWSLLRSVEQFLVGRIADDRLLAQIPVGNLYAVLAEDGMDTAADRPQSDVDCSTRNENRDRPLARCGRAPRV
jgi:hypothetical protein